MSDNRTTELLQKIQNLLDERGAEYTVQGAYPGWLLTVEHPTEVWTYKICVNTTGLIGIWGSHITPEQAIAATLGNGTCELTEVIIECDTASEWMLDRFWVFDSVYKCSCGKTFGHIAKERPKHCPHCGGNAKVVEL